jgi:hypothetical protein
MGLANIVGVMKSLPVKRSRKANGIKSLTFGAMGILEANEGIPISTNYCYDNLLKTAADLNYPIFSGFNI